jgi:glycosyltransferase involved in cell wall biosynthesis
MRAAFHAPMKPPDHPVPSGDRRMARAFVELLTSLGIEVELAARFRSYDRAGDPARQARLGDAGLKLAERLVRRYRKRAPQERPALWFTYHLYHKAPDWLGPTVSTALGIPYLVAEASLARKQAAGPWAIGYHASRMALARADLVLAMTNDDLPGLRPEVAAPERLVLFPPFLDTGPFVVASGQRAAARARLAADWGLDPARPWLLAVAMMRADVKRLSYQLLARALAEILDLDWQLVVVGDGEAKAEIEAMFAPLGAERVRFVGAVPPEALPGIHAAADLMVWPACREAYGMALLEAQAAGVPVVAGAEGGVPDIVEHEATGFLVAPRRPEALAAAARRLLAEPGLGHAMGQAAQVRAVARHDVAVAQGRLRAVLPAACLPGSVPCASA